MAFGKEERWYANATHQELPLELGKVPSVTTILSVIDKSGPLMAWAVSEERKYLKAAFFELIEDLDELPGSVDLWRSLEDLTKGMRQADRLKTEAANLGKEIHAACERQTRVMLKLPVDPAPKLSPEAAHAFKAWKAWAKKVRLKPILPEKVVYHLGHKFAGTMDLYAEVEGKLTVLDYKSGKRVYKESFLQNVAYREAAKTNGYPSVQGMVVRLPKVLDDPEIEVVTVPEWEGAFDDFLAAQRLWQWVKRFND